MGAIEAVVVAGCVLWSVIALGLVLAGLGWPLAALLLGWRLRGRW